MNWLPKGWSVGAARRWVHVRVPGEAQDDPLELSRVEAFAVAAAIVRAVGRSWLPQAEADAGQVGAGESAELGPLLDERFGVSLDEFLDVLRRLPPRRPWSTAGNGDHEAEPLDGVDEQKSQKGCEKEVHGDRDLWARRSEKVVVVRRALRVCRDAPGRCRNLVASLRCLKPGVVSDEGRTSADGRDDE